MARPLRIEYDGAVYHVTSRGNERKNIFEDDEDRLLFLDTLKKVNEKYNWLCHAYCLMNNHYHFVIETPDGNLSKGMRQLNGVYTQYCSAYILLYKIRQGYKAQQSRQRIINMGCFYGRGADQQYLKRD